VAHLDDSIDDDLPYYPSSGYLSKKWAPKKMGVEDLTALARARRLAEEKGVITREMGEFTLPMAIEEYWRGGFGVRTDTALYAKPSTIKRFTDMGLLGGDDPVVMYKNIPGKGKHIVLNREANLSPDNMAKMMMAVFGDRAALADVRKNDDGTPFVDDAIMRYNGRGRGTEILYGERIPANVREYLRRVKEVSDMRGHPGNKQLMDVYSNIYNENSADKQGAPLMPAAVGVESTSAANNDPNFMGGLMAKMQRQTGGFRPKSQDDAYPETYNEDGRGSGLMPQLGGKGGPQTERSPESTDTSNLIDDAVKWLRGLGQ